MHQDPINAESHCISPPAEHQSLAGRAGLHPRHWTDQGLLEVQPVATSRPNQKSALSPIGTVVTPPGIGQYRPPFLIATSPPPRVQINATPTSKRFNPLRSRGLQRLHHRVISSFRHRMAIKFQTPVGCHACPQDFGLFRRLFLSRHLCLWLPCQRPKPYTQPERSRRLSPRQQGHAEHWFDLTLKSFCTWQDRLPLLISFVGV